MSITLPFVSLPTVSKATLLKMVAQGQATAQSVAHVVDTYVSPAQAALQMAKQTATHAVVSLLPEPFAQQEAQNTIKKGVQWGAKVGGYFGPIGTVVGVGVGAATTIGLRYLMFDPNTKDKQPVPEIVITAPPEEVQGLANEPVVEDVVVEEVIAVMPPLNRAQTI